MILAFIGFMIGFTSKVLAQYGAPVMHFKLLGQIKSAECEQPIGGVEITLVNDATGQITKVQSDENGNFNFRVVEYYWDYEFSMNLADIDGDANQGEFVSKSLRFKFSDMTEHISESYWDEEKNQNPLTLYLDFDGKNPCIPDSNPKIVICPDTVLKEEDIMPALSEKRIIEKNDQPFQSESKHTFAPRVFPNPNDGRFTVEFSLQISQEIQIQIFTLQGQLIEKFHVYLEPGQHSLPINLSEIPAQTILLRLFSDNMAKDFRVVVL